MTKNEIINQVLNVVRPSEAEVDEPCGDEPDDEEEIIADLQSKLPDGVDIKTCDDLRLNLECCDSCHTSYPHYEMKLVNLPDGTPAWLYHTVIDALFPNKASGDGR